MPQRKTFEYILYNVNITNIFTDRAYSYVMVQRVFLLAGVWEVRTSGEYKSHMNVHGNKIPHLHLVTLNVFLKKSEKKLSERRSSTDRTRSVWCDIASAL